MDLFGCTFGSVSLADIFELAYKVAKSSDCRHLFLILGVWLQLYVGLLFAGRVQSDLDSL